MRQRHEFRTGIHPVVKNEYIPVNQYGFDEVSGAIMSVKQKDLIFKKPELLEVLKRYTRFKNSFQALYRRQFQNTWITLNAVSQDLVKNLPYADELFETNETISLTEYGDRSTITKLSPNFYRVNITSPEGLVRIRSMVGIIESDTWVNTFTQRGTSISFLMSKENSSCCGPREVLAHVCNVQLSDDETCITIEKNLESTNIPSQTIANLQAISILQSDHNTHY